MGNRCYRRKPVAINMDDLKHILDKVQKPGRYIGEEVNSVRKNFSADRISVCLAYPDMYEVGMSYLGMKILYHLLNERDDCLCERVFAPWDDMEKELVNENLKLFSLESKTEVHKFDIVGFSLAYELTFTNVLNMLHLSGITLFSDQRREEEPLVIAGGACCYNPEPMSKFIDAFLIGDGEESLPVFLDEYKKLKSGSASRREILKALAKLPGVYVPAFYAAEYREGRFCGIRPTEEGLPSVIEKRHVDDLENAYYPVKQIVPLIKIVHDRIVVEVMRGCPNQCRFCQASAVNRPVRLRSPQRVREICRETYRNTGYEQIALLSLSSVNYPHLPELIKGLNEDFKGKGAGIAIPSLRVDEKFYRLPEMMSVIRKAGLTFAPESASENVLQAVKKDVDYQVLCKSALQAYSHGWRKLKLYFIVGFPGEPEDEAEKIIRMAHDLSRLKRKVSKGAAEIKVSVNPFIPKPHTPLQWLGMRDKSALTDVKNALLSGSSKKVQIEFHDINKSVLEATLSRGDRRMGDVIYHAWKNGARMDGWSEFFNFSIWEESFKHNGIDLWRLAVERYSLDDALPWSHIGSGVGEKFLKAELAKSGLF